MARRLRLVPLVLGVLSASAVSAIAQPRQTAIVNLAEDQASGALAAREIRSALENDSNLNPLRPGVLARSLEDAVPSDGPEAEVIARARAELARAKTELDGFREGRALSAVREGESQLLTIAPTPETRGLLAELTFFAGRVHLREQNKGLARSSFELVLRLAPDFPPPDPGRFNPDIVSTFAEAKVRANSAGTAMLEVTATFDGVAVFVDGTAVGSTPLALAAAAGSHYISVVSPEYKVAARRVDVGDGDAVAVAFELEKIASQDIALRLRQSAMERKIAVGGPPLAEFAASVAVLTGAENVVLIRGHAGEIEQAAYRSKGGLVTPFRSRDEGLASIVALLSPVRSLLPGEFFTTTPKPVSWYRRPEVVAPLVGGSIGLVAIVLFAVSAADDAREPRPGLPVGF